MNRVVAMIGALALAGFAEARVVRIVVEDRKPLEANRQYEMLTGHAFGELDPRDPLNAIINDIGLAPRNGRGKVEYAATFTLMKPIDAAKASGVLIYQVPNRGNSPLQPRPPLDELNGGHILLSSGWQGDLAPRPGLETITVPIAKNTDGSPITGPVIARLMNLPAKSTSASLTQGFTGLQYQRPASLDTSKALLTRQFSDDGELIPISPSEWSFGDCVKPDSSKICLKAGFEPDMLYQLVYTARDPLVLGIGLAATRDIISFFRYGKTDNPVSGIVKHAIGLGTSQSGNFIKTFIHLGFNQDEEKRIVWEGVRPHIAGRQNPLNFRFAIPGGAAGLYEPGSEGVLWWSDYRDLTRNRPAAGLLDRCRATSSCPKVMETFGATEFWGLRMSPGLVGTKADEDIPLPPEVRRYYFPGVTHGGGRGGFNAGTANAGGGCVLPANPNSVAEPMRALEHALIAWVTANAAPPASRYPTLASGELVQPEHRAMGFPAIPGWPLPDNLMNGLPVYDFGPDFNYNDLSGFITRQPPAIRGRIPMLAPKTDADGNEIGGAPSVLHQAPLGTYLGWNVTASGYLKGRACGFSGAFIPFAGTKAERLAAGDPRPSIEERYGSHEAYVARVKAAAGREVALRFLLPEDAERLAKEAEASNVLR
jgi:hypothetical protein